MLIYGDIFRKLISHNRNWIIFIYVYKFTNMKNNLKGFEGILNLLKK